jgi:hypothetical protein
MEVVNYTDTPIHYVTPLFSGDVPANDGVIRSQGDNPQPIDAFIQAIGSASVTWDVGGDTEYTGQYTLPYWYTN